MFAGWQINRVVEMVGEEELIRRTNDLPAVKAYVAKYNSSYSYLNLDFHVGVVYSITECELTGKYCGTSRPYVAYLEVRMDEWNGYPERFDFACNGDGAARYGLDDSELLDRIAQCA